MGVYSSNGVNKFESIEEAAEGMDLAPLEEAYIYDELSHLTDENKKAFLQSEECKAMEEKALIGRKTLVRLDKNDDLTRRTKMAAFEMAKQKGDVLWDKLALNRVKERDLISKIMKKYGSKAQRIARVGQREHLKKKMPTTFMRKSDLKNSRDNGGDDR